MYLYNKIFIEVTNWINLHGYDSFTFIHYFSFLYLGYLFCWSRQPPLANILWVVLMIFMFLNMLCAFSICTNCRFYTKWFFKRAFLKCWNVGKIINDEMLIIVLKRFSAKEKWQFIIIWFPMMKWCFLMKCYFMIKILKMIWE